MVSFAPCSEILKDLGQAALRLSWDLSLDHLVVRTFVLALECHPSQGPVYLSTDINIHACICTRATGSNNNVSLVLQLQTELFDQIAPFQVVVDPLATFFGHSLLPRLQKGVDLILFNPPYVPTPSEEASEAQTTRGIDAALSGGLDGMEVTKVFLGQVSVHRLAILVLWRADPDFRSISQTPGLSIWSLSSQMMSTEYAKRC